MRITRFVAASVVAMCCLAGVALGGRATTWRPDSASPDRTDVLRLVRTILLPEVQGRIDHLAFDPAGNRLFVAALGNDTIEVIDLSSNRRVAQIDNQHKPQGLAYLAGEHTLVVANGDDAAVRYYDGRTLALRRNVPLGADGDNVRVDVDTSTIYVGYGDGAIAGLDVQGSKVMEVPVGGHPESFQLEARGPRIFVNVPTRREVVVVDRASRVVTARWPVVDASSNYAMALDEDGHRLFVATRQPARLLVLDTDSGKTVAHLEIVADCDDLFYDREAGRLYAIGGGGAVTVIATDGQRRYRLLGSLRTAAGARTGLFVPAIGELFVAVPARIGTPAELRVFAR